MPETPARKVMVHSNFSIERSITLAKQGKVVVYYGAVSSVAEAMEDVSMSIKAQRIRNFLLHPWKFDKNRISHHSGGVIYFVNGTQWRSILKPDLEVMA